MAWMLRGSSSPSAPRESPSRVLFSYCLEGSAFCHPTHDHPLHFPQAKMQPMTKRSRWST